MALPERYVGRDWFTYGSGYAGMQRLLAERPVPTAVFCANDHVAIGAINAAAELGVSVPGDVAVIGFDDLPIARWPVFNLTTVRVAFEEMSEAVVELLLSQLRGGGGARRGACSEPSSSCGAPTGRRWTSRRVRSDRAWALHIPTTGGFRTANQANALHIPTTGGFGLRSRPGGRSELRPLGQRGQFA